MSFRRKSTAPMVADETIDGCKCNKQSAQLTRGGCAVFSDRRRDVGITLRNPMI
jgi:hypothetical protein